MTTLRIQVADRRDALDLAEHLSRFPTHLFQLGRDRWYVAVHAEGEADALAGAALDVARAWADERGCDGRVRVGGRTHPLRADAGTDAA